MPYFIDVILPIPLEKLYTYQVSEAEAHFLKPGMRVAVPFGKTKIYTGLVYEIHQNAPQFYEAKEIDQILDETPVVTPAQLTLWNWISEYYMCSMGEVFRAAMPGAFLLESETLIMRNENFQGSEKELLDDEWLVFEALQHQSVLKVHDVSSIIDKKNILPVLKRLLEKEVITVREEVYEQYKPKKVRYVRLAAKYKQDAVLQELLDEMNRAPKQKEVILSLFSMTASSGKPLKVKDLEMRSGCTPAVIKALINKGILDEYYIQTDRIDFAGSTGETKILNEYQGKALEEIQQKFEDHDIVLLHGVTSSGKTEVYVKCIEECLAKGKQVLYLLPEIALTTQLIQRLQRYFGKQISVYHSRYSVNERVEVWNNLLKKSSKTQIILGARSSVLLPFSDLGLVIVDEEHEPSFKQFDPAPRYHARDVATVLARTFDAKTLLGSATPSIESMYNAVSDKFGYVEITRRYGNVLLPEMELVDIKDKRRKKKMQGHFSDRLIEEIKEALDHRKQVIIFQNRRGYAPIVECNICGHSPQCPNCDVSLTYHQYRNQLRCHYCGYHIAEQKQCLACGSPDLDTKGLGTEQVQEELKQLFPEAEVGRMDSDTTKGKHGHEKIINAFEEQEIDILVGTQMITKGLDFRNVSLVGIMNADTLLNFPDFRAHERSYQLIQQVAGRAGRTDDRGKVIIQSHNPLHQILQQASMNKYADMFKDQLEERRNYKYPPFYRLIKITFKHKDYNKLNEASDWYWRSMKNSFSEGKWEILGPVYPPVSRIRNEYIKHILLKIPPGYPLSGTKDALKKIGNSFQAITNYRSVKIVLNVDTY